MEYTRAEQDAYTIYLQKLHQDFANAWQGNVEKRNAKLTDFEKLGVIGTGTFGAVYLVKHIGKGKYYAMKTLDKEKIVRLKHVEHTFYEKKILCSLKFPFVIHMKFFIKDNIYLNYVLPFINGGELFLHLRKTGKFTEASAKFYSAQVILAFEYLHTCKLLYRDLKPENILVDRTGYIKISDFRFCKLIHGRTWTLCGTPEYLAPEIILSKGYGMAADWWSFGVLVYEMCAGYPPFFATDPMQIYEKIVAGTYKCPLHFTLELKDLLAHIFQVEPSRRYGSLRNGIMDFKTHLWFRGTPWDNLLNTIVPAPFIPNVTSPADTKYCTLSAIDEKERVSPVCLFEQEFADF